jgi:hypothetical protein
VRAQFIRAALALADPHSDLLVPFQGRQVRFANFAKLEALPSEGDLKFGDRMSPPRARRRTSNPRLPASPPITAVDWTRPLTCTLTLKTGERLTTLHDAADLFTRPFGSIWRDVPLAHVIRHLFRAAETGSPEDCKAATDQVAFVLRLNAMM